MLTSLLISRLPRISYISPSLIQQRSAFCTTSRMSSAYTSTALHAVVSSPSKALGAVPEGAKELEHHNKNGKGFINPWPSYIERGVMEMGKLMGG